MRVKTDWVVVEDVSRSDLAAVLEAMKKVRDDPVLGTAARAAIGYRNSWMANRVRRTPLAQSLMIAEKRRFREFLVRLKPCVRSSVADKDTRNFWIVFTVLAQFPFWVLIWFWAYSS